MLFLCRGNVISVGPSKAFVTIDNVSTVEVAVRALTLTDVELGCVDNQSLQWLSYLAIFSVLHLQ